jgi:hypothetical protein
MKRLALFLESQRVVVEILRRDRLAAPQGRHRFADDDAVHDHAIALRQIYSDKFMLGRDIGCEHVPGFRKIDYIAFSQIAKGDKNVIRGIELQHLVLHRSAPKRNHLRHRTRQLYAKSNRR